MPTSTLHVNAVRDGSCLDETRSMQPCNIAELGSWTPCRNNAQSDDANHLLESMA